VSAQLTAGPHSNAAPIPSDTAAPQTRPANDNAPKIPPRIPSLEPDESLSTNNLTEPSVSLIRGSGEFGPTLPSPEIPVTPAQWRPALEEAGHDVVFDENTEGGHAGAINNEQAAFVTAPTYEFLIQQLFEALETPQPAGWLAAARRS